MWSPTATSWRSVTRRYRKAAIVKYPARDLVNEVPGILQLHQPVNIFSLRVRGKMRKTHDILKSMTALIVSYIFLFVVAAAILFVAGNAVHARLDARLKGMVHLLVSVPQTPHSLSSRHAHEVAVTADLYARLHELRIPFVLEAAVHGVGEEIHFYLSVAKIHHSHAVRLIETLIPGAYVTHSEEYQLWLENGNVAGGYLRQTFPSCIPLKTGQKGLFEPFLMMLRALSNLAVVGEGAAVQWVVQPAGPAALADVRDHLQKFERGEYHPSRHLHEAFALTPQSIKLIEQKARSPLFAVNCRLVATELAGNAKGLLKNLLSHLETDPQTHPIHNHLAFTAPKDMQDFFKLFLNRRFAPNQTMILTADELATFFHLPGPATAIPKLRR